MRTFFSLLLIVLFSFACKSGSSISNQAKIAEITGKIESKGYRFIAQTAIPMSSRSVSLNGSYSLKIVPDTISSYLPYFGRAYVAPYPNEDGGIKFISTNFEYTVVENKKGTWDISIITKDTQRKEELSLNIGNTGYATLTVREINRQPITFYGRIE